MILPTIKDEMENSVLLSKYYYIYSEDGYENKSEGYFADLDSAKKEAMKATHYPPYDIYCLEIYKDDKGRLYQNLKFVCKTPNRYNNKTSYYILIARNENRSIPLKKYTFKYNVSEIAINYDELKEITRLYPDLGIYKANCLLTNDDKIQTTYELVEPLVKDNNQFVLKKEVGN